MARTPTIHRTDFDVEVGRTAVGYNLPQRIGRLLWKPMLAMALMAFPLALVLAIYRASLVAQRADAVIVASVTQYEIAVMFLGFASAFAAISFSIARILGVLRSGGSAVQEAAGREVQTLRFPLTALLFIALMAMAMMGLLFAVIAHAVLGSSVASGGVTTATVQVWAEWLEGLRRFSISTYLLSIFFGFATVFKLVGFQAVRIRELPAEPRLR